ncbi:S9 family peptidase [Methylobacterium sp. E-016]|uniref:S9 family peptidase n=1 Tax=Methylobacterium sp. E-016 TaxID=2836556 RepID=UPI001FBA2DE7|nr:S9 family peptidase [Methylobacterium sp. E-016]MCJ2076480.1 S9 family peptidase [Methylobacterium sp. E-016]
MIELIPRAHLFGNPLRTAYRISRDGTRLAWLAPVEGVLNLWVGPAGDPASGAPVTADRHRGIRDYEWAYDGRHLLYLQDTDGDENHHLHAVDPLTGTSRDLTPIAGVAAYLAKRSKAVHGSVLVGINARDPRFHDLYAIDVASGARRLVQENPGFAGFLVGEDFSARLAIRTEPDGASTLMRPDGDAWTPWLTFPAEDSRVSGATHLDAAASAVFCRDSRGRDTAALTRVDLATGAATVLAHHPEADIGAVLTDVDSHEPLAYAVDRARRRWHVLDPRVAADFAFLEARAIGDWHVTSRSEDDRIWLIAAESDLRPWATYLYDRAAGRLDALGSAKPELDAAPLRPMAPLTIRARDGLDLVCYLTRPAGAEAPGAMVLVVHGGPWARNRFGCNIYHQWLANRGYAVLDVNFRGSTGFGKAFVNAGDREWGRRMDDDLLDAVAWAVEAGVADPSRVAILGASYGGYAVLAALARNPGTYACGIDVVGPANLETLVRTIPPYWESFRAQLYRAVGDPDTADGLALIRARSPVHVADRIKVPLLIAQGANDPRVRQAESDQMVAALVAKRIPVTYLLFPDEGHGFARPENSLSFHARAEAFLGRHLGGRVEPIHRHKAEGRAMRILRDDPPA